MARPLDRGEGRRLFGADPAAYEKARPDYPRGLFELLERRCGPVRGRRVLEIGAGTGKATAAMIALGAGTLTTIEPDPRLAAYLRTRFVDKPVEVIVEPFETAGLGEIRFDLAISGTAFHWLDEDLSLAKIAGSLRPGGWWAPFWNVFGDPSRADPFHEATKSILNEGPRTPSMGRHVDYALDEEARFAAFARSGAFEDWSHEVLCWNLSLDVDEVVALYATYSNITARSDAAQVLARLREIALAKFPSGVTRNMITSVYFARRAGLTRPASNPLRAGRPR